MKASYFLFIYFVLTISCKNAKNENLDLERKVDSVLTENARLNDELNKVSEIKSNQESEIKEDTIILSDYISNSYNKSKIEYAFIKLLVEETYKTSTDQFGTQEQRQQKTVVSDIEKVNGSEDKAKLETAVINNYLQFHGEMYFTNGKILSTKIFAFPTYEEASKKRNSYLISN